MEARDRGHYLGSPYIIGGDGTKDDFHILTQIIKIAPGVIKEAINKNAGHRRSIYLPPRSHRANRLESVTSEGHRPTRLLS